MVKGRMLLVDLGAADGFDESDIDMAFGLGTAQRSAPGQAAYRERG